MNNELKTNLLASFNTLNQTIAITCDKALKNKDQILILAASKKQPIEKIKSIYDLGVRNFGENYLQEALEKKNKLPSDIIWHFIGHIQSNKTKLIAESFDWVHTVDRLKLIERLSLNRGSNLKPLNICLEINVNNEANKSGFLLNQIPEINTAIELIKTKKNLKLRGLMCLPELTNDLKKQRQNFALVYQLMHQLNKAHQLTMDTLSMGTSNDLESAILEGANLIRIGSMLFGPRI